MSTTYKPEIDGLRAIAVLAVVGFHAGFGPAAGFVGVDVFFVISGYLITRMLRQEVQAHQRIDIMDFYARRARRILPALLAVTLATLAGAAALLPAAELKQTMQAGAAAFAFAANVFFGTAANGYFDVEAHANPLLHLWSIGVEEQFYLAWPLVVLLARKRPALVFGLIVAASLAAAQWLLAHGHDQWAFYQAPLRAWELAAGGLIAVSRIPARRWMVWLGLLLTALACAVPLAPFPGTGALPAVLGACLIVAGVHAGGRNALLASRPAVAIGKVSYSLYLWHWPIIVLGEGLPRWVQLLAALLAAGLSYAMIEQPFRKRWVLPARATVGTAAAGLSASFVFAGALSMWITMPTPAAESPAVARARLIPIYDMGCDDWYESARVKPCVFGEANAKHTALLAGDSVVMQWFPAVRRAFDRPGWKLVVLTKSSCPMVEAPYYYARAGGVFVKCAEWRTGVLRWAREHRPEIIILGSANNYSFSKEQWLYGTRSVVERAASSGSKVILVRSTPLLKAIGQDDYDDVHQWELEATNAVANVDVIDMNSFVCPRDVCSRSDFLDRRHINATVAEALAPRLLAELKALDILPTEGQTLSGPVGGVKVVPPGYSQ